MGAPVYLNVYDLIEQNGWTIWCGVGVFHTGVEVYGVEYAFGGHEYDVSGVFATAPREAPGAVMFRTQIPMGQTDLTPAQVQALVRQMGQHYKGNTYHLLQSNCNHFASDLCVQLVGRPTPPWINRLAGLAVMLHCLLPVSWVPPLATPSVEPAEPPEQRPRGRRSQDAGWQLLLPSGSAPSDTFFEPPQPPSTADR
ncbi:hypothetical protein Rsub_07399 [Raphidocelis subcapitata]|uniref:PPPDE domain-containing protein n=1 Tax=Raphidocelis subcapitata TaxID=307507 RepID=A0A2V0P9T2_9CHLO|nr:hypothetical protein Rsub_07399 [Raphidocelis subcapitata]|eukprot:GBF94663.1 hypothetical protein Rsub_07399 [Raphidocelis subcapitata]